MLDYFIEASNKFNYKSFFLLNSIQKRKKVWFIFKGKAKIMRGNNMAKTNNAQKFKIFKKGKKKNQQNMAGTGDVWLHQALSCWGKKKIYVPL